jgi:Ca2+-transporting ATPase
MEPPVRHSIKVEQALTQLNTTEDGLTQEQAQQRLREHGPNTIPEKRHRSLVVMFLGQFSDFMILVLLVAAVISGFIGEPQGEGA